MATGTWPETAIQMWVVYASHGLPAVDGAP
jgi:hypothetical protein